MVFYDSFYFVIIIGMKIIMMAAISKDGFLTRGDEPNPSHWTSDEDKAHLQHMLAGHGLQVFGSKTYEAY